MSQRAIPALVLAVLAAACTSPNDPDAAGLTGRWDGTVSITECVGSAAGPCPNYMNPGVSHPAALLFTDSEDEQLSGFGVYGEFGVEDLRNIRHNRLYFTEPFSGSISSDGNIEFSGGYGKSPGTETSLSWSLKKVGSDRLEGTLTAGHTASKATPPAQFKGTVVLERIK